MGTAVRTHSHADKANDGDDDMFATPDEMDKTARSRLRSFLDRIERQETEKAEIAEGIKETYAELKGEGFDAKIMRRIVAIRKQDPAKRAESEALLDTYLAAIGED